MWGVAMEQENLKKPVEGGDGIFVIRGGKTCRNWNGIQYKTGLSAKNVPARHLSMNVATIPPGGVARAHIMGDTEGMLKLIFHRETLQLLGVHIIGERASELIHVGQAVVAYGGTIEYFIDTVVNYPTLSEAHKVAALNGYNRL